MDHWGEKMQDTRSLPGGRKRLRINKSHVEIYLLFLPVLVWYIFTELGSIAENAAAMGAPVPGWRVRILAQGKEGAQK